MTVRKITVEERRNRLARRHHLAPSSRAKDIVDVAGDVVGLHATDPATVFLTARARMANARPEMLERALYDDRTLVRMLGMRRTMFIVPFDLAVLIQGACANGIAARERRRIVALLERAGIARDGDRWLRRVERAAMDVLVERGEVSAAELSKEVPEMREGIPYGEGKKWAGTLRAGSQVLFLLAAEGKAVRGRPRGSWVSTQYRWSPTERWFDGGWPEVAAEPALVELVRRWLRSYGPGTVADIRWWAGSTAAAVKRALAQLDVVEVELGGDATAALLLADDDAPVRGVKPWAALLPALDPTVMGWIGREWYLGANAPALFDRSGNAGPTVWWDGRVVGGWAQRADGTVAYRMLEDAGAAAVAAVENEAGRLEAWLADLRVVPKFRTPLERELSA